jgi:hypothetical protein
MQTKSQDEETTLVKTFVNTKTLGLPVAVIVGKYLLHSICFDPC